jgi:hypothetical protein
VRRFRTTSLVEEIGQVGSSGSEKKIDPPGGSPSIEASRGSTEIGGSSDRVGTADVSSPSRNQRLFEAPGDCRRKRLG